ncbi:MAG: hypothetical protein MK212_03735 [Saprospiraceae bacterium]|nr:hypothetical protein [Saprospiraceae bacterium]
MTYNILDDQRIDNGQPKGNPYKLVAWMVASAFVLALTIFCLVFFMEAMHISERANTLRRIHKGLEFVPVAAVFNAGVFAAYLVFFSQNFERHLKGQLLKSIALSFLIIFIAFLGFIMYGMMSSRYISRRVQEWEYWMNWGIFMLGYTTPVALAYYFAWQKRLHILLIVVFICLCLIQSFMMVYVYPRL